MSCEQLFVWSLIAYLFGSMPSGYVFVKFFLKTDIRQQGSGNIGATNVLRIGGGKLALVTYILDMAKVWVPMFLFKLIMDPINDLPADVLLSSLMIVGGFGVIGHMYSCWLKFNGGKGVAPLMGYFIWLFPYGAIFGMIVFLVVAFSTKFVSLASLAGVTAVGIYVVMYVFPMLDAPLTLITTAKIFFIFMVILIFWRHKSNIQRLIQGEENKIKF